MKLATPRWVDHLAIEAVYREARRMTRRYKRVFHVDHIILAMRLAKLTEYRRLYFTPDSAPSTSTLRAQIDRKEIPGGCKRGRRYFVDLDEHDRDGRLHATLDQKRTELAKSPELQGLI